MTCLEHLIENCLIKFENSENKFLDAELIMKSIEIDPNLPYAHITADQCYEICQYIYYSYVPYVIDRQCGVNMMEGEQYQPKDDASHPFADDVLMGGDE